jgi:DNA-binding transcriptional LysR family regulator
MEIHQMFYICAAEDGGFTVAARVHGAQLSRSQQIIELEEIGDELFHRFYRKIRLTGLGQAFFPGAQTFCEPPPPPRLRSTR